MIAKKEQKSFNFKDFSELDQSDDAEYLIHSMDELFSLDCIQEIKKRAIKLANVEPGSFVLELGCGLGDDAKLLGQLVGEYGRVDAIDSSSLMIEEAKKRSNLPNVFYEVANATQLKFKDETFDICHMDRLLVSQRQLDKVVEESLRVLKHGGKLCVTDCDFGFIVLYPFDPKITNILIKRLHDIVENPLIGRQLLPLYKKYSLKDIHIISEPYIVRSFPKLNKMIDFPRILKDLYIEGFITKQESEDTLKGFEEADKDQVFIYGITFFTAVGVKP